jgi:hypothetical protein
MKNTEESFLKKLVEERSFENSGLNPPFAINKFFPSFSWDFIYFIVNQKNKAMGLYIFIVSSINLLLINMRL